MNSPAFDAFVDDCFLENDPICDLRLDDSLVLDDYVSKLIEDKIQPNQED